MSSERTTGQHESGQVPGGVQSGAIDETAAFDAAMVRQTRTMGGAAPADHEPSPELPPSFGRYRIQSRLGFGGMGSVYLARDTQLERDVALKVPRLANDETGTLVERFLREARAAATLSHPNICPIFDVGQESGTHFIAMGYIEGRPLTAYIESGKRQPERQVAIVVRKIALALQEAHARGIVHRDLKPANIMIDRRGEPIVMDFGLACRMDDRSTRLTQDGILVGTPAYMSPEQIDQRAPIGPPADIYSLGVLLYELLTGRCPFGGNVVSVIGQVLHTEPKPVAELRPDVSVTMAEICRKSMSKHPEQRFATMLDMAWALTDLLKQEGGASAILEKAPAAVPITAEPLPKAERLDDLLEESLPAAAIVPRSPAVAMTSKPHAARKRPQPVMAIVLGVAGLLLLGVVLTIVLTRSADNSSPAVPTPVAKTAAPASPTQVASAIQKPAKPAEIDLDSISSLPKSAEVKPNRPPAEPPTISEPPLSPRSASPAPLEPATAPAATAPADSAPQVSTAPANPPAPPADANPKPEPPPADKWSGLDFPPGQQPPEKKDQPDKDDLAAKFRQNDRNGDGKLDPGEAPMHVILRADKNRDHAISLAEIEAAYKRLGSKLFDPPTAAELRRIPRPPDGTQGPGPGGQGPGGPNRPRPPRR